MSQTTPRIWDRYLTERDRSVFAASGYAQRAGYGERPAVSVIDVSYNFAGDRPEPILESIKRWPNSCGEASWPAIEIIGVVLAASRSKGLPIIYSTYEWHPSGFDLGGWPGRTTGSVSPPKQWTKATRSWRQSRRRRTTL